MYVCVVQCACDTYNVHALRTIYTSQVQCACITYIVRARRRSMYAVQVYSKIFFFSAHCGSNPSTIDCLLTNSPVLFSNIYTLDNAFPSDHSPVIATIEGINGTRKTSSKPN